MNRTTDQDMKLIDAGVVYTAFTAAASGLASKLEQNIDITPLLEQAKELEANMTDILFQAGVEVSLSVGYSNSNKIMKAIKGELTLKLCDKIKTSLGERSENIFLLSCLLGGAIANEVAHVPREIAEPVVHHARLIAEKLSIPNRIIELTIKEKEFKQLKDSLVAQNHSIFIVHGHDDKAKEQAARLIMCLGLKPIILHEMPNKGQTVIEKFEQNAMNVVYAIVLMTPDDELKDIQGNTVKRARQNVILEWGYFAGKLGRGKVCILHKESVEIPSDILGMLYVKMDSGGAWRTTVAKEMKAAGVSVDLNKL